VLSEARENALPQSESIIKAPEGAGSICKNLEALARATGVSERLAYSFQTELHFADVLIVQQLLKLMYSVCILIYVSMYLYSYPSTHGISGLAAGATGDQFEAGLKMTIE
jgi:hypothetical protein